MTSSSTFPDRFTKIDDLSRPDHSHLQSGDLCLHLGKYTARAGYGYSATNQIIMNFKKPMDRKDKTEWKHKGNAIKEVADAFGQALSDRDMDGLTFVPIPPSKTKNAPLHDDRLTQMLKAIPHTRTLDIRELIVQTESTAAAHSGTAPRLTPQGLENLYEIDHSLASPAPEFIAVVDDVLTTGAHFRAASSVLSAAFPDAEIVGLFIARSVNA